MDQKFHRQFDSHNRRVYCLSMVLPCLASDASLVKRLFTITPIINTISKIILPAFIAHFMLLVWTESIMHSKSIEFSVMHTISIVLFIFPLAIIGGMILHILIELPFMKLMKSKLMEKKE